ncbi:MULTISPECIES: DUF3526 domain-containing protein [Lysobacter]|uniref:DUF3526 domain-containing protein n=1 Tax=Lysobacter TaxID=68 RepID=UPI001F273629|nr:MULTISPECIES: DUF3526 domain-containing protein [Lysobacter]UJB18705.1 DUF3526 domain-containing protein [Lysobacter capsici]UJQ27570.1 DUF3526 domain-containing protein [Lysobacter gummosus]
MSAIALETTQIAAPARVGFATLLAWELRHVGRSRLLWTVIGLLAAAMLWGAYSGAALHRAQDAAIERSRASDAQWMRQIRERAQRYAEPAPTSVPYWQDPTDIAGFSRYFLRAHSYKPNLPLSPLAVGGSDLMPSRLPVKLETPFGVEPAYDFENPRGLGLGRFDLGFVLVYLLPIAVIVLIGLLSTFERDHGMLRLIAAQRVGPRAWLGARVAAIFAWVMPATLALLCLSLSVAGANLSAAIPELFASAALVVAYLSFWAALGFVVVSAWPGAAGAISLMSALWALLAIGLPLLGSALSQRVGDAPTPVAYVDATRRANDAIAAERDAIVGAMFRARADLAPAIDKVASIDYATRMSFLAPETERRLQPLQRRQEHARDLRETVSEWAGYLSPPLGMEQALSLLAGTDAPRQRRFEHQTRVYQLRLREWFYPRIQRQIATPTPRPIANSYGRMNFNEYADIPVYTGAELPPLARAAGVAPMAAWLLLLAAGLCALALHRLRRWPTEL